jgi:hypothetical protein
MIAAIAAMIVGLAAPTVQALPETNLMISELFVDVAGGGDNRRQWVELYNSGATDIVLTGNFSLGSGRTDYTRSVIDLVGTVSAGQTFIVGGDFSDVFNHNPTLDQVFDFAPNLQRGNNNTSPDGLALFTGLASAIAVGSNPIHVVIYGEPGTTPDPWLTDESGLINSGSKDAVIPTSGFAGESISFDGATWSVQATPSPGLSSIVPEPGTGVLFGLGLVGLAYVGRKPQSSA